MSSLTTLCLSQTVEGVDFEAVSEQLVFSPGAMRQCVDVTIIEEDLVENDEPFPLTASGVDLPSMVTVDPATTMVTILNDDGRLL